MSIAKRIDIATKNDFSKIFNSLLMYFWNCFFFKKNGIYFIHIEQSNKIDVVATHKKALQAIADKNYGEALNLLLIVVVSVFLKFFVFLNWSFLNKIIELNRKQLQKIMLLISI